MSNEFRRAHIRTPGAFLAQLYKSTDPTVVNANEDYSGLGAAVFIYVPPQDRVVHITRLTVTIRDADVSDPTHYGDAAALGVGVKLSKFWGTAPAVKEAIYFEELQTNLDWIMRAGYAFQTYPAAPTVLVLDVEFVGPGIMLDGGRKGGAEFLGVSLNDDLSGLDQHSFVVHGFVEPPIQSDTV